MGKCSTCLIQAMQQIKQEIIKINGEVARYEMLASFGVKCRKEGI